VSLIRLDVNDAELRETFLRRFLFDALAGLQPGATPAWGRMTAQQMVEHLAWIFEVSTGRSEVDCAVPEAKRERFKRFLYDDMAMPRDIANPALVAGLPPLRHGSLPQAATALRAECDHFLECARSAPHALHTHPVFGPIAAEEWSRSHFKHGYHHLLQFGLV
jgi:oxepin-CoA hydrolase/3-oxo-5,6-dehydrosuberyl-CoA semialdehyde dehydrogenase